MARSRSNSIRVFYQGDILYASWYVPAIGRVRCISLQTSNPRTAYTILQAKKEELGIREQMLSVPERPLLPPRPEGPISVRQALDDYYQEHVIDSGEVADKVRQENGIRHLKVFFRATLLRDVDIPACRAYRNTRRGGRIGGGARHFGERAKAQDSTIRRELNILKAAANHALRWKRIPRNDMPTFELPKVTRRPTEALYFSRYALATLIFEARGDFLRDAILLCYHWGARRRSVEALHKEQVDLRGGFVNLAKPTDPVTEKRKPIVPIFRPIRHVLERRVANADSEGYLFGKNADFYRAFSTHCWQQGIAPENPHALRHTRATHMLMAGESIYKVARLLVDTVAVVERVYGHHSPDFFEDGE